MMQATDFLKHVRIQLNQRFVCEIPNFIQVSFMAAVGEENGVDARRYSIDLRKQAFPYCDVDRSCRELARMFYVAVLVKFHGGFAERKLANQAPV